jgi:hypothetical protein
LPLFAVMQGANTGKMLVRAELPAELATAKL